MGRRKNQKGGLVMGKRKNQKGGVGFLGPMLASMAIPMVTNLISQIGGKRVKKRRGRRRRIKQRGGFRSSILRLDRPPPIVGRWGPDG